MHLCVSHCEPKNCGMWQSTLNMSTYRCYLTLIYRKQVLRNQEVPNGTQALQAEQALQMHKMNFVK